MTHRIRSILVVLIACLSIGAIAVPAASADQGDFGTQWVKTRDFASSVTPCYWRC